MVSEPNCKYCGAKFSRRLSNNASVWGCGTWWSDEKQIGVQPAECRIAQLEAKNKRLTLAGAIYLDKAIGRRKEIAQLKAENKRLREFAGDELFRSDCQTVAGMRAALDRLEAESQRLRWFAAEVRDERDRLERLVEERSPGLVEYRLAESILDALVTLDAKTEPVEDSK